MGWGRVGKCVIMPPALKKLRCLIAFSVSTHPSICSSQLYIVDARVLKFLMMNPYKNVPVLLFFFLSELSPIFELCPFD